MTEYSPVTPEVVAWAIDESGLSVEEIAGKLDKLKVVPADVSAWATGAEQPTKGQLTKLAETLRRPRAMFFLPEAPEADSLPDGLRKPAGERATDQRELTFDERIQVRRARYLQEFVATLVEDAPALPAADSRDDAGEVAVRLRRWTGVSIEQRRSWGDAARAFRGWREAIEARGVTVLALPLGKEGIRGFALPDERAPVIAVNTADIVEARGFTLFHELAHLVLGTDSACSDRNDGGTERWCDRVASHVLIPRSELRTLVAGTALDSLDLVKHAANRFGISRRAAAIALEDIGAVENAYALVEAEWPWVDREKKGGGGGTGRPSPRKRIDEYGEYAVGTVLRALDAGRINEIDAARRLRLDRTLLPGASELLRT